MPTGKVTDFMGKKSMEKVSLSLLYNLGNLYISRRKGDIQNISPL